jgi:hypothetical protein
VTHRNITADECLKHHGIIPLHSVVVSCTLNETEVHRRLIPDGAVKFCGPGAVASTSGSPTPRRRRVQ